MLGFQGRIQDSQQEGPPTLHEVAPSYDFAKFSKKNCMNWENFGPGGVRRGAPLDPSLDFSRPPHNEDNSLSTPVPPHPWDQALASTKPWFSHF